jgi:hypothetical protein
MNLFLIVSVLVLAIGVGALGAYARHECHSALRGSQDVRAKQQIGTSPSQLSAARSDLTTTQDDAKKFQTAIDTCLGDVRSALDDKSVQELYPFVDHEVSTENEIHSASTGCSSVSGDYPQVPLWWQPTRNRTAAWRAASPR